MQKKKLIEVALPLEAINKESAREKSIRHGHPSTLHLWWARRPLAACRAVLWASLVDDPSSHPDKFPTEEAQAEERGRLFRILEQLVKWENSNNEHILALARAEIMKSTDGNPPPVLDPFCGGGSIPLEAQRPGLEAHGSDLNPVAVLITKALIEIPPKFANKPPVNPADRKRGVDAAWKGAAGLAADVRYYGKWMRDEAEKRVGHLYPKVKLPEEYGGGEATVIAWLWARTVTCPNPACGARMPLVHSFWLSTKKGKQAWVEPIVDQTSKTVRFEVRTGTGTPQDPPKIGRGAKFRCLVCNQVAEDQHIKSEGLAGRVGSQLMATVAEGKQGRSYLSPPDEQESIAASAVPVWAPTGQLPDNPRWFSPPIYGMTTFADLFTPRQLVALTTFSDLVAEARERVRHDAVAAGLPDDGMALSDGGTGTQAYADAMAIYLGLAVSRAANTHCTLAIWSQSRDQSVNAFSRQALPMTWDYPEVNPFAGAAGDLDVIFESIAKIIKSAEPNATGTSQQADAKRLDKHAIDPIICTDPPYYDNIGYADLSDFFYVWLRRSLGDVSVHLFTTLLSPKTQELIASPYRFEGDRHRAEEFFEHGLSLAFARIRTTQNSSYPLILFYAFKQTETDQDKNDNRASGMIASTGWETMLEGLLESGFAVLGTWPMRTERPTGVKVAVNALASSVVLVCRPRPVNAPLATRTEFIRALRRELPTALRRLQYGNIAPVDLAQAAIGPGMAIFSRYSRVLEANGEPMRVRTALQLINQALDEVLAEQEGEFDSDTRWAVAWFEQHGMNEGPFGEADTLSRAKNTSVSGMVEAGIVESGRGKVRLLRRSELPDDWDPRTDRRITAWEVAQYLIRALEQDGESGAAELLRQVGGLGDLARDLAYRLYTIAERKKWAQEALAYNSLVIAWPEIQKLAAAGAGEIERQASLI